MEGKPLHYDGSVQNVESSTADSFVSEPFKLTDEMRNNISSNPYVIEK
ncbi:MAG: hypothetical protein ACQEWV_16410 [Bacillota bacterium]